VIPSHGVHKEYKEATYGGMLQAHQQMFCGGNGMKGIFEVSDAE